MTTAHGAGAQLQRLLALVPYVLARPGVSVAQVARDFDVPPAQVLRDLNVLWFCGLPGLLPGDLIEVDMDAARGGAVHVTNADPIARPLRLQVDEALALLVALRALAEVPGLHDGAAVQRTIAKLESAAGDAARASAPVAVDLDAVARDTTIASVRAALDTRKRLHLTYYVPHRDESTERDVDPMRLLLVGEHAYLEGWCRRAEDVRLFRLDRVTAIEVLDVPLDVPAEAEPRDLDEDLFRPAPTDMLVTLELQPAARWVTENYPVESVDPLGEGRLLVRLRTADTRWLRRLVLRLGGSARVLDPPELDAEIRSVAAAALRAYDDVLPTAPDPMLDPAPDPAPDPADAH
jgi:proteasome accessory factor C